jgi:hypothetical protein
MFDEVYNSVYQALPLSGSRFPLNQDDQDEGPSHPHCLIANSRYEHSP